MFPPLEKSFEFLLAKREMRDNRIMLYLPTGDSFYLKPVEVSQYLKMLGFEDYNHCVDYIWNFRTVVVDLVSQKYIWIGRDRLMEVVNETQLQGVTE